MQLFITTICTFLNVVKISLDDEEFNEDYFSSGNGLKDIKKIFFDLFEDVRGTSYRSTHDSRKVAKDNLKILLSYYKLAECSNISYKENENTFRTTTFSADFRKFFSHAEALYDGYDAMDPLKKYFDEIIAHLRRNLPIQFEKTPNAKTDCYFLFNCCKLIVYKNKKFDEAKKIVEKIIKEECKMDLKDKYLMNDQKIKELLEECKLTWEVCKNIQNLQEKFKEATSKFL